MHVFIYLSVWLQTKQLVNIIFYIESLWKSLYLSSTLNCGEGGMWLWHAPLLCCEPYLMRDSETMKPVNLIRLIRQCKYLYNL